jgi:hypothetical protein
MLLSDFRETPGMAATLIGEFGFDPDYAQGIVERSWARGNQRSRAARMRLGQDHDSSWHDWKEDAPRPLLGPGTKPH